MQNKKNKSKKKSNGKKITLGKSGIEVDVVKLSIVALIVMYLGGLVGQAIFKKPELTGPSGHWGVAPEEGVKGAILYNIFISIFSSHGRRGLITIMFVVAGLYYLYRSKHGPIIAGFDDRNLTVSDKDTYGTSDWMGVEEMYEVFEVGRPEEVNGNILGCVLDPDEPVDDFGVQIDPIVISTKLTAPINKHIAVFGASGTGKSRSFVRPQIIQSVKRGESVVVTDPKGELYATTAHYLKESGYDVKVFNLVNQKYSDGWAALLEITKGDEDPLLQAQVFADVIIQNTTVSAGADYFVKAEQSLLTSLLLYILYDPSRTDDQKTLGAAYELLSKSSLETLFQIFDNLPANHPAKPSWEIFKKNERTQGSTLSGLGVRLQMFQTQIIKDITGYNEIDLVQPGKERTALFVIMSDTNSTFNFLSSLFFSFLFIQLINYADIHGPGGALPVPVNFILDEFPNIGLIPDFEKKISTIRSRELRVSVIFQTISQLANRYPGGAWSEIIGNCDTQLFLGCTDPDTAKFISERSGEMTVDVSSRSFKRESTILSDTEVTRGESEATGRRMLLNPDEVLRMPSNEVLIISRGRKILKAAKFDFSRHPDSEKFKDVQMSDRIPEWRKKKEAAKMVMEEEMENVFIGEEPSPSRSMKLKKVSGTEDSSDNNIKVSKRDVNYELNEVKDERDFLDDIEAHAIDESDIISDFDEKVDMSKPGAYVVTLKTKIEDKGLTVIVNVAGPKKRTIKRIRPVSR